MSFNLNKLVQPECGAPNPLVAAAQQISNLSGPTSLAAASQISRFRKSSGQPVNFANEFMKNRAQSPLDNLKMASSSSSSLATASTSTSTLASSSSSSFRNFVTESVTNNSLNRPFLAQISNQNQYLMQQNQVAAGDQLEEKYRHDMLQLTNDRQDFDIGQVQQDLDLEKLKLDTNDKAKVDDVEFWQSLSQKFVGPTTFDSAQPRQRDQTQPSLEYTFDERNPLKDQFEDPFKEGVKRLKQGDIPSAALLFEAAVQNQPTNGEAWRYLGTTQAQNEKDMSAIQALRNCLNVNPLDQQARLAISVSLANEMQHHEACKHLLEWLIKHENYRQVGANLDEFKQLDSELSDDPFYMNSVDQKHYMYVRDKFIEAARMSPNNPDPEVQSALGVLFNIRGEYEKAVDCFKAALSVQADDSLLWNRLGATLANGSKPDEAVIAYRKALEISPGFLRSRYNLAISLIHLNIYDEAAKQLVQILKMQAAGRGSKNAAIRSRSITSTAIWNTLRTVATLMNKPDLYPIIDGRDLPRCEEEIFKIAEEARCLRPR